MRGFFAIAVLSYYMHVKSITLSFVWHELYATFARSNMLLIDVNTTISTGILPTTNADAPNQ